jgi:Protein of unknown function (DUF3300)
MTRGQESAQHSQIPLRNLKRHLSKYNSPRKSNRSCNMNTTPKTETVSLRGIARFTLLMCLLAFALFSAITVCFAQSPTVASPAVQTQINTAATQLEEAERAPTIHPEQLEALVAPIALYPDPLLIQVLAASTYPLEIVQLKQWMDENKKLNGKALAEAVSQQNWDPSVQALSAFRAVVEKLANKVQWTTDLGNAFLAQESDVMDAVQDLRAKANANGALKTNNKQTVGTEETRDGKQAITIEPAQRDVVYVPTYKTEVVYRDSGYSNDSSSSGYSGYSDSSDYSGSSGYSDAGYSYLGYAVAAAYGYYWGRYDWRDGYGKVNDNNYYVKNSNAKWSNNNYRNNISNRSDWNKYSQRFNQDSGRWQHDPSHRGNAPYGNTNLANRFGQANNRLGSSQLANRASQLAKTSVPTQAARGNLARPNSSGARPSTRSLNAGAPSRVGNRVPSNWPNGARGGAFGPSNGNLARAFSGRGAQSMAPSRMGPPQGLRAGGPPMGGGFHGGPPMGGGFHGGPPMGGGLPGGGAPPPPPPPAP